MQSLSTRTIVAANIVVAILVLAGIAYVSGIISFDQFSKQASATVQAQEIFTACASNPTLDCYEDELVAVVEEEDFALGEQSLYALQDLDPATKSCHVIAHHMSGAAVRKSPKDWEKFAKTINVQVCGSGFLHGVLEAHIGDDSEFKLTGQVADELCNNGIDVYRDRMCAHFIGHIAMVQAEGNLAPSIITCQGMSPNFQFDCLDGVFMEHHQKFTLAEHEIAPLPEYSPAYLTGLEKNCRTYRGTPGLACWTEMAEVYAKVYNYDTAKVYSLCTTRAPDDATRQACYSKGVGILVTYPLPRTTDQLLSICLPLRNNPAKFQSCNFESIAALMAYSPKFADRAIILCADAGQPDPRGCFEELGSQLRRVELSLKVRQELCLPAPEQYRTVCGG